MNEQGERISLISKALVRYEGTLAHVNTAENTVSLDNVQCYGTESRPAERFVAAQDKVYEKIIFKGTDIKELQVIARKEERKGPHWDPAVLDVQERQARGPGEGWQFDSFKGDDRKGGKGWNAPRDRGYGHERPLQPYFDSSYGKGKGSALEWDDDFGQGNRRGKGYNDRGGKGGKGHVGGRGKGGKGGKDFGGKGGRGGGQMSKGGGGRGGGNNNNNNNNNQKSNKQNRRDKARANNHTGTNFKTVTDEQAAQEKSKLENFDFAACAEKSAEAKENIQGKKIEGAYEKDNFFDNLAGDSNEKTRLTAHERQKHHDDDVKTFGQDAVKGVERSFQRSRHRGPRGKW